jgi:hypothetical protein
LKMEFNTRCWWLALVILATQEVGIRKMGIWSQPRQTVCETPSWKYPTQMRTGEVAQVASMRTWFQTPVPKKQKKKKWSIPFCSCLIHNRRQFYKSELDRF